VGADILNTVEKWRVFRPLFWVILRFKARRFCPEGVQNAPLLPSLPRLIARDQTCGLPWEAPRIIPFRKRSPLDIQCSSAAIKPSEHAGPGSLQDLKLNGPAGLLLDNDRSRTHPTTTHKVANSDFYDITAS
jgi:hypothetical protein